MNKNRDQYLFQKIYSFLGLLISILLTGLLTGCKRSNPTEEKINEIPVSITIDRFDRKFHNASVDALLDLKRKYSYLFPERFPDSVWINRKNDSLQLLIQNAVDEKFANISPIESEISHLFQHIKYYFPKTTIPHVVGLTNNVDYQTKTVYTDSLLLISLDTFLGADHSLYEGFPMYIREEMDITNLPAQIIDKFGDYQVSPPEDRTLLAQMIYYGKKLYLKDLLMPHHSDAVKIGYSEENIAWINKQERNVWQYFIERELLYQTHPSYVQRFINPAPFSKFYLEIDNESPGRVGCWLGWQIVRAFVKRNPEVSLGDMLKLPSQIVFSKSNYKPKH